MTQSESTSMYRRIVKATGLLGGVQVFSILCSVVRNKCIALWLGAAGVGVIGLYNAAIEMIGALTSSGLRQSAVRDISQAHAAGDERGLKTTIAVVRRWNWIAGLFGAVIMLSFAPLLSRFTFGDEAHLWGYVWLSCALLLNALTASDQSVLQGIGRLRKFSSACLAGNAVALLLSLPLYYFFRFDGIVPSIILSSAATLFFTALYRRKAVSGKVPVTMQETWHRGKAMVVLGVYMTISGFLTTLFNYLLVNFINRIGGETELGYYQSGYTIVTRYVGLVLAAMATEYYPRLAALGNDARALSEQVARQSETALLMLAPIVSFFLLLQEWVIRILYTVDFLCVDAYFSWAMVGVLFKAVSWAMGFILLAKGDGIVFLITETVSGVTGLLLTAGGYYWGGLEGAGIAYLLDFFLYSVLMWAVCRRRYGLRYGRTWYFVLAGTVAGCSVVSWLYRSSLPYALYGAVACAVAVSLWALWLLKKRLLG